MNTSQTKPGAGGMANGFTLIELLVVIAVIAIIAAMLTGLGALAARKKHDAVVTARKNALALFISTYYSKMGFYPPDNALNVLTGANNNTNLSYENSTGMNPLLYELTGAPVTNVNGVNYFLAFDGTRIAATTFSAAYGRGGIANSLPDETRAFYQPLPGPKDYLVTNGSGFKLNQLAVPVPRTFAANELNLWHYDCSSASRHNSTGFDLWAEYLRRQGQRGQPHHHHQRQLVNSHDRRATPFPARPKTVARSLARPVLDPGRRPFQFRPDRGRLRLEAGPPAGRRRAVP